MSPDLANFADDLMLAELPTSVGSQKDYYEMNQGDMPAPRGGSMLPDMGSPTDLASPVDLAGWFADNKLLVSGIAVAAGLIMFTPVGKPVKKVLGIK